MRVVKTVVDQVPDVPSKATTGLHNGLRVGVHRGQDGVDDTGSPAPVRENSRHWDDFAMQIRMWRVATHRSRPVPRFAVVERPQLTASVFSAEFDCIEESREGHPFAEAT